MAEIKGKTHALLGPSGAHRWAACPGSVVLEQGYKDKASVYAAWGSTAHELAEMCLWDGLMDEPYPEPENAEKYVGRKFQIDGFDIEVDMEMADCVNTYCSYVHGYVDLSAGDTLHVEVEVPIEHITGEVGATGTSDVVGYNPQAKELIVIDLKGGQGVTVDAEGNPQLGMYADGALKKFPQYDVETIRGVIIQPRKNHVSEYVWTRAELEDVIRSLHDAARDVAGAEEHRLSGPKPDMSNWLIPGEKQCKFCRAKPTCPALLGEVLEIATAGGSKADDFPDLIAEPARMPKALAAHIAVPSELENATLEAIDRSAPLMEGLIKAARAELESRLFEGQEMEHYGLFVGKLGNRAWTSAEAAEAALKAARLKADEMYTKQVISPTAAEKLLKSGRPKVWAKVQDLITRAEGKATVDLKDCGREPYVAHVTSAEDFPHMDISEVVQLEEAARGLEHDPLFD